MTSTLPIALITGATGGLAQAAVAQLKHSHQLVLVGRDLSRLQTVYGDQHTQLACAYDSLTATDALIAEVVSRVGHPTVLLHCVGSIKLGALHRLSPQDFMETLQTNLHTAYFMLTAFVKHLRLQKLPGAAVFVSSAAARIGTQNHEAIATAKAGLEGLVVSAAASYAANHIRINAVAPGILDTPAAAGLLSSEAGRAMAAKQYPIVGIGEVAPVADLMAWLVSDQAKRVTGQIWSIDGGFSSIRPLVS